MDLAWQPTPLLLYLQVRGSAAAEVARTSAAATLSFIFEATSLEPGSLVVPKPTTFQYPYSLGT